VSTGDSRATQPIASGQRAAGLASAITSVSIVGIGLSLTMTLLSVRLAEQGYSARAIGLNPAAGGIATLAGAAFVPVIARRLGIKPLLFLALLGSGLSLAAFAATENYWSWLIIRGVFSLTLTVLFIMSEYWINTAAPPERRGLVLGLYTTSLAGGFAAGPAILAAVGTAGLAPFIAGLLLFAAAAVPILIGSSAIPDIKAAPKAPVLIFLTAAPVATLAGLLHGAIETASLGLLPVYALQAGLLPETGALLVTLFALGNVAFQVPIGHLSDRMDRSKLLLALAALGFCGSIALALVAHWSFTLFAALLVIWGGVVGALYAVGLAHLGARYQGTELASANAAFIMLYSLGMLLGPPIIGLGQDLVIPDGFFLSIAFLLALYLVVVIWRRRRHA
jgi:MFS family permease